VINAWAFLKLLGARARAAPKVYAYDMVRLIGVSALLRT